MKEKIKYLSDTCIMFLFGYERNIGLKRNICGSLTLI